MTEMVSIGVDVLRSLREERDELAEEVRLLREGSSSGRSGSIRFEHLRLRPMGRRMLVMLADAGGRALSWDYIAATLGDTDPLNRQTVSVHLWHLRRALKSTGVTIEILWGEGLRLPPASLTVVRGWEERDQAREVAR